MERTIIKCKHDQDAGSCDKCIYERNKKQWEDICNTKEEVNSIATFRCEWQIQTSTKTIVFYNPEKVRDYIKSRLLDIVKEWNPAITTKLEIKILRVEKYDDK